ncbi:hypothetical protein PR202_ga28384 [Eleusine coracana subsp. coracana]|uniref:Uncharacterized protein n=1 Tax=Eleusine coracana subsp. coracana TaxID=191504 RepID=A0AAV5DJB8_ELECO|nr:hypothetical protein PR202_ga28384 [Eleusine coracana subsp. coracana]
MHGSQHDVSPATTAHRPDTSFCCVVSMCMGIRALVTAALKGIRALLAVLEPSVRLSATSPDGELVELLWQNGAVVAHSQAPAHHHHHHHRRAFGRGPSGGTTGASGVTGESAGWLPDGGALGGDMYAQLWHNIAQLEGRVDGDTAASAWPPASSGAGSSRTGGEVGSSLAPRVDDDVPGASTLGGSGLLKRARDDEFDSRSEDADFEDVDEARPSRQPASSKRRTRSAEFHNMSERTDKASILDEAIEYLNSLQMQVQIMWMTTGVAPMMLLPGAHQLMSPMGMGLNSSCMPPTTQVLSQMQRVPPFFNNPLPNQTPGVSSAATSVPNVANQVQKNRIAEPRNPFLHPNGTPAVAPELPTLFGYGSQMAQQNEIQELLAGAAAPALGVDHPSSSDGTGTS